MPFGMPVKGRVKLFQLNAIISNQVRPSEITRTGDFGASISQLTLHEHVGDVLDDVVGGEQDEDGEEKRAHRVDPLQVRVEVDHDGRYHHAQALNEIADHMN